MNYKNKQTTPKEIKKKILVTTCITLLLIAAGLYYSTLRQNNSSNDLASTTDQETLDAIDSAPSEEVAPDETGKRPATHEESGVANDSLLRGVINYKSVIDENLSLRVTIEQQLNTGDCILTATRHKDGKSVSRTAKIISNPSSATCQGFDIPITELGDGVWGLAIEVRSGGKVGKIEGEISI